MNNDDVSIRVSAHAVDHLMKSGLLLPADSPALWQFEAINAEVGWLHLRRAMTEPIRDALTVQLAESGFDDAYEPNAEGRLIEDLIDLLFVP